MDAGSGYRTDGGPPEFVNPSIAGIAAIGEDTDRHAIETAKPAVRSNSTGTGNANPKGDMIRTRATTAADVCYAV